MNIADTLVGSSEGTDLLLDPAFPYGEDLLQFIWEAGLYDAHGLRTTDGDALEVLKAGRIQPNSGPDLNDAVVRVGGQTWAGTVEVHLRSSEWNAHGHQHDPAYNNVVLHSVYLHDAEVHTADGRRPPTVELRGRIDERHLHLHQALMESRREVPCAPHLHAVDLSRIRLWLERLLVARLERKVGEMEALYRRTGNDPAETLHHVLLRWLGGQVNAEAFSMLAHGLPLKLLLKYRDDRRRVEALLFGQAGFLEEELQDPYAHGLQEEYRWLSSMHGLRPMPVAAWKYGRLRPPNFPTVRLAQWAALVHARHELYAGLLEQDDPNALLALLNVEAGGYWDTHYRFGQPAAARPKRLGGAAAAGLIINAIVPYLFAMGRIRGFQPWQDRALALMERLPAEQNTITRMWEALGIKADNAGQGQALVELRKNFCAERKCLSCAIGTALHKSPVRPAG
ncbi:MAG TPA: DUF2851 family protein [Flavobacteriales bacterium]|nr:DUF2851 family protein [Flavobacteriales bacterium]